MYSLKVFFLTRFPFSPSLRHLHFLSHLLQSSPSLSSSPRYPSLPLSLSSSPKLSLSLILSKLSFSSTFSLILSKLSFFQALILCHFFILVCRCFVIDHNHRAIFLFHFLSHSSSLFSKLSHPLSLLRFGL
ncbi:hypothetical protein AMTRI_Chr07g28930 [Amborella trichopoda]